MDTNRVDHHHYYYLEIHRDEKICLILISENCRVYSACRHRMDKPVCSYINEERTIDEEEEEEERKMVIINRIHNH